MSVPVPTGLILARTLLLAAALHSGDAAAGAADETLVQTKSGPVQGQLSQDGQARSWLGIPYAAPPLGELRWKAPRPHAPWTAPLPAAAFGPPCMQIGGVYLPPLPGKAWGADNLESFGKPVGSEDCLSLNLWRPHSAARSLPVLVFVHGGSNLVGGSADPLYDGARLAVAADALVVTVNYRLGLFGWLTHPALQQGDALDDSGNYGTLDLVQALRFVRDNAAAFGGDPGNVTLAGQSAGAIDIYQLLAAPLAAGLFHKVIPLSGLIGATPREEGYRYAERLAAALLLRDGLAADRAAAKRYIAAQDPRWLGQYLRTRAPGELLQLAWSTPELRRPPNGFGDGAVLPRDILEAYDEGRFQHLPALVGTTRDEGKLFTAGAMKVGEAQRFRMMLDSDPDAPPRLTPRDLITPWLLPALGPALYDTYAWAILALARHRLDSSITRLARWQPQVYAYRFDWNRGPEPWRTVYGAAHAIDLPFLFGNFSGNFFAMDFSTANRPGREALSRLMMQSVAAFIRSGDPNVAGLGLKWEPWTADGARPRLVLDASDKDLALSIR